VAVAVKFTGMDESVVRRAMEGVTYTSRPSIEGEEEYVKFLNYLGYITTEDVKGFVNRFIVGDQSGSVQ